MYRAEILERISDAFVALDATWRFLYVNDKACEVLGRPRSGLTGRYVWDAFPSPPEDSFRQLAERAMQEQQPASIEQFYEPLGRWFESRIYPSPKGLAIYFTDITARVTAERGLRAERDLSTAIVENLPGVFYLYDDALRFLRWNRNFETVTGYTGEEIARMSPLDFFRGDAGKVSARIREVFEAGASSVEAGFATRDGRVIPYYFTGSRIEIDGRPCLVGLGIDITDRKLDEDALHALSMRLQTMREEEAVRISRELHDELGQSLTALKMDLVWIERRLTDPAAPAGKVRQMMQEVDRTIQTVRRISSELRPALLDDLGLAAAVEWQSGEFARRSGIRTVTECGIDETCISPDRATALYRIMLETLTNITRHAQATAVRISLRLEGEDAVLEVRDNGRGMDVSRTARGLGIVGMRERARAFGGHVELMASNQGVTVTARLPLA